MINYAQQLSPFIPKWIRVSVSLFCQTSKMLWSDTKDLGRWHFAFTLTQAWLHTWVTGPNHSFPFDQNSSDKTFREEADCCSCREETPAGVFRSVPNQNCRYLTIKMATAKKPPQWHWNRNAKRVCENGTKSFVYEVRKIFLLPQVLSVHNTQSMRAGKKIHRSRQKDSEKKGKNPWKHLNVKCFWSLSNKGGPLTCLHFHISPIKNTAFY